MLAVVVSRADEASVHVGEHLVDLVDAGRSRDGDADDALGPAGTVHRAEGTAVRVFAERHLDAERAADAFDDPDCLVFASRHAGETGPLLTAHHTGNFGPAEYGGEDGELARAAPLALHRLRRSLAEHAPPEYDVGVEATHHGPSEVGVPSLFAEVGSAEPQWADPDAARAVARAILDLRGVAPLADPEAGRRRHVVGFGGGHYAPRFDRLLRETDWAVGHVAADWALEAMGDPRENRAVIERAFERSEATLALVDGDRPTLEAVVEDLGHRIVTETWLRETSGVPLGLVERLEDALVPVDAGLRFGDRACVRGGSADAGGSGDGLGSGDGAGSGDDVDVTTVGLPEDLLATARGIDREAARDAVAAATLAFVTEQNGTVAVGPAAVADPADRERVVDGLADVLRREYDEVVREGDDLVARTEGFDPARAREAGVPEGPKFGRLADGEAVEVDGRTVSPEEVSTERERRFDRSG